VTRIARFPVGYCRHVSRLRWIVGTATATGSLLVSGASALSTVPRANVSPASGLLDAPFRIRLSGLAPRSSVQLRLREPAFPSGILTIRRTVKADARGVVDLPRSRLLALVAPSTAGAARTAPRFTREITISVLSDGRTLATTHARRIVAPASVAVRELRPRRVGLYGEYHVPATAAKHRAVLLLGGSEGGMPNGYVASLLAAHGYPVLALAYFGEPGLASALEKIPLEYFQRALTWLRLQPEVDPNHITVVGTSRGGELALLLGSTYPGLVGAVAAYVPSDRVNPAPTDFTTPAWTLASKALQGAPIMVEKIAGPVFVVGAVQDHLWPSSSAVLAIRKRMQEHGRTDLTVLDYPAAGHGVGVIVPNIPTTPTITSRYGVLDLGGSPLGDANARADSWPRLLRFLATS
jgi:dienelactone hydrolase